MNPLVLLSTFGLGLRHGVDWDHLAAISDITGTEIDRRRSSRLALLYALGHGAAVMVLGSLAILAGEHLPTWIDPVMERVVGVTLLVLAVMMFRSLRARPDQPVSRGVLLYRGIGSVRRRLRNRRRIEVQHAHGHAHDLGHGHDHDPEPAAPAAAASVIIKTKHEHPHVHAVDVTRYGTMGAFVVGILHGVGAETGTQAVVLVSATHVASGASGLAVLGAFVAGIVATTAALAIATAYGWSVASRQSRAVVWLTRTTVVITAVIGLFFVTGNGDVLPAILA